MISENQAANAFYRQIVPTLPLEKTVFPEGRTLILISFLGLRRFIGV
jgi:hypothetical protein